MNCCFGGTRICARDVSEYQYFDMAILVDAMTSGEYSAQETATATNFNSMFPEMLNRLKEVTFTNQIVTLNHGTNDWSSNCQVSVYQESLKTVISKLAAAYPDLQIVLLSPTWRCRFEDDGTLIPGSANDRNDNGDTLQDFVWVMEAVAEECSVEFIDCYDIGINETNCRKYFDAPDGVHLSQKGRMHLAKHISAELAKIAE